VRFSFTLEIDRPVDEVFAYVTNLENLPAWQGSAVEARQVSEGPMRVGAKLREVRKFLGRRIESELEVTEFEPGRKFSLKVMSGPLPYSVEHAFESFDARTRITVVGEGDAGGFFKVAEPMVVRAAKRQARGDFETLKKILEGRR
jgi:uncharacterized membrane protein